MPRQATIRTDQSGRREPNPLSVAGPIPQIAPNVPITPQGPGMAEQLKNLLTAGLQTAAAVTEANRQATNRKFAADARQRAEEQRNFEELAKPVRHEVSSYMSEIENIKNPSASLIHLEEQRKNQEDPRLQALYDRAIEETSKRLIREEKQIENEVDHENSVERTRVGRTEFNNTLTDLQATGRSFDLEMATMDAADATDFLLMQTIDKEKEEGSTMQQLMRGLDEDERDAFIDTLRLHSSGVVQSMNKAWQTEKSKQAYDRLEENIAVIQTNARDGGVIDTRRAFGEISAVTSKAHDMEALNSDTLTRRETKEGVKLVENLARQPDWHRAQKQVASALQDHFWDNRDMDTLREDVAKILEGRAKDEISNGFNAVFGGYEEPFGPAAPIEFLANNEDVRFREDMRVELGIPEDTKDRTPLEHNASAVIENFITATKKQAATARPKMTATQDAMRKLDAGARLSKGDINLAAPETILGLYTDADAFTTDRLSQTAELLQQAEAAGRSAVNAFSPLGVPLYNPESMPFHMFAADGIVATIMQKRGTPVPDDLMNLMNNSLESGDPEERYFGAYLLWRMPETTGLRSMMRESNLSVPEAARAYKAYQIFANATPEDRRNPAAMAELLTHSFNQYQQAFDRISTDTQDEKDTWTTRINDTWDYHGRRAIGEFFGNGTASMLNHWDIDNGWWDFDLFDVGNPDKLGTSLVRAYENFDPNYWPSVLTRASSEVYGTNSSDQEIRQSIIRILARDRDMGIKLVANSDNPQDSEIIIDQFDHSASTHKGQGALVTTWGFDKMGETDRGEMAKMGLTKSQTDLIIREGGDRRSIIKWVLFNEGQADINTLNVEDIELSSTPGFVGPPTWNRAENGGGAPIYYRIPSRNIDEPRPLLWNNGSMVTLSKQNFLHLDNATSQVADARKKITELNVQRLSISPPLGGGGLSSAGAKELREIRKSLRFWNDYLKGLEEVSEELTYRTKK